MANTDYQQCLDSLFNLHRFGIKLELDTIRHILESIGNPQQDFKSIHIAGTNGKGSVAALLSSILQAAGYQVGRYTSPHLVSFNERICINNQPVTDDDVIRAWKQVSGSAPANRQPTFFEFTTAMAFSEFSRHKVDWAVIETGMGGRMDATNIIQPEISIITNISLEHKTYLGNTIEAIAFEKAGIIKKGVPLVTGVRQKSARNTIMNQAAAMKAPVLLRGKDFRLRRMSDDRFTCVGPDYVYRNLTVSLSGAHQFDNASLAVAACELLSRTNKAKLPEDAIRYGLQNTNWPGRLEIAHNSPLIILDGAHNLMAASVLAQHLASRYSGKNITLVIGILNDKPYHAIMKHLIPLCHRVIVTQADTPRAISALHLEKTANLFDCKVQMIPAVDRAVRYALDTSDPQDVICVAGSLYVVGEAKRTLEHLSPPQSYAKPNTAA